MINIITKSDSSLFDSTWNAYLKTHEHSLIYTLEYIKYYYSYCKDIINDLSFIVIRDNKPVGLCFLPLELTSNIRSISLNNGYVPAPLYQDKKIEKTIFEQIHEISQEQSILQIKFYSDPNLEFNIPNKFNTLKKFNFLETNNLNSTIYLEQDKEKLWSNLSKSFKSLINKYSKNTNYTLHIMDNTNPNIKIMQRFWKLHCDMAGQYAREFELFEAQYNLIEKGYASLYYIMNNDEIISYSLFFHYNRFVVYVSSVSKNLEDNPPLSHFILWNATINFKKSNNLLIQYGQPSSLSLNSGIDDISSQKELGIATFKRNMGAQITTLHRGIKYFDKQLLANKLATFLDQWSEDE